MRFITGAVAASTLIGAVCGAWLYVHRNTYATEVGEQRVITLADGSAVELNARSKLTVHYTAAYREVDLVAGQALFRVAHDPGRPFTVVSGDTRIRAVGTEFDVYRRSSGSTTVTVIEGRVSVASADTDSGGIDRPATPPVPVSEDRTSERQPPGHELLLSAGEQVSVGTHQGPLRIAGDPAQVIAWTQGRLVFSGTPLSEVAEEFNRYNTRPLVIESPEIATLRVNGVFSSTDLGTLLAFLREQPGIAVAESETEIRLSHR
jgi:transmembrane sensor